MVTISGRGIHRPLGKGVARAESEPCSGPRFLDLLAVGGAETAYLLASEAAQSKSCPHANKKTSHGLGITFAALELIQDGKSGRPQKSLKKLTVQ